VSRSHFHSGSVVSTQGTDGLVSEVLTWRSYIGALRYLNRKAKPVVSKSWVGEYEALERARRESIGKMIQDWDRLVGGIEGADMIWNSNLTVEIRERDIEAWFGRWVSEKRQFLDRGSSREAKTSSHEQTKKTIVKMVDTAVGQEQSSLNQPRPSIQLPTTN